jgi:hypothetical protein
VSRPDLWPHMQVQDHQFREFARQSIRKFDSPPPINESNSGPRKVEPVSEDSGEEL